MVRSIPGFDLLHPEELFAFHLVETHLDEVPGGSELRDHLELKCIDTALGFLDFIEETFHRCFNLGTQDDRFHEFLEGGGGLIDDR